MKSTLARKIAVSALIGAAALSATTAALAAGSDAFNRNYLGPKWVVTNGKLKITNHQMASHVNYSLGYLSTSANDTAASAVMFLSGTGVQYGAVALGDIGGNNNAFVKIQEQDGSGMFEYGSFYTGNNAIVDFFTLSSPVPSPAILDVYFCGTTATMVITSSAGVQTYSYDYGTNYGGGGGLGIYGPTTIDNYVGFASGCADVPKGAIPASQMAHTAVDLSLNK